MSRRSLEERRAERTQGHGNQAHRTLEAHGRLMVVVLAIAIRPQAILLVVIGMARHPLVRVDLLDMVQGRFLNVRRPGRTSIRMSALYGGGLGQAL